MEYNKLSIFYLALTEKNALDFLLNFLSNDFQLPAGVQENEPALKSKFPQTVIQA